jgi:hypothetical protein
LLGGTFWNGWIVYMLNKPSHLYFNELNNDGKKTRCWEVTVIASDGVLGTVSFWGAWRKYVFKPASQTLYDASCLREIAEFTESETKKWRDGFKEQK